MTFLDIAKKHEDYIIAQRRHFHENPEVSGKEFETVKHIMAELDKMGVEYVEIEDGGILAKIVGDESSGRAVALRGDIDALPVNEPDNNLTQKRSCKSKKEGVMHACGHDGHTAMLLGAIKVLLEKKDEIKGTVYFCFERGEEGTGNIKHVFKYLDDNKIHIDTCFAFHLHALSEAGRVSINDGGMMAGSFWYGIEIEGTGGHGSRPDQANSPIAAFVALYNAIDAMRMTKIGPFTPLAHSVGAINAGSAPNIIPQTLHFTGTARFFDRDGAGKTFKEEFMHLVDSICKTYKCTYKYTLLGGPTYPVVNDAELAGFARGIFADEIGAENVGTIEPWMGSESFGRFIAQYPGVFALLGMKDDAKGIGAAHHNPEFDLNEDVLATGSACAARYAVDFLKSSYDTSSRKVKGGYRGLLLELEDYKTLDELGYEYTKPE